MLLHSTRLDRKRVVAFYVGTSLQHAGKHVLMNVFVPKSAWHNMCSCSLGWRLCTKDARTLWQHAPSYPLRTYGGVAHTSAAARR